FVIERLTHVDAERVDIADVGLSVLLFAPGLIVELVKPASGIEASHWNEDVSSPRVDSVRVALFIYGEIVVARIEVFAVLPHRVVVALCIRQHFVHGLSVPDLGGVSQKESPRYG